MIVDDSRSLDNEYLLLCCPNGLPAVEPGRSLAQDEPEDLDLAVSAFLLDEALEQDGERASPDTVQEVEGDLRKGLHLERIHVGIFMVVPYSEHAEK